jgi:hypothetical protein
MNMQVLNKILETLQILYTFLYYMVLDQLLPSTQRQSFLESTRTSSERSLVEFYTILLEEHLQVDLEMLEWESVPHSSLQNCPEWFSDVQIW